MEKGKMSHKVYEIQKAKGTMFSLWVKLAVMYEPINV